jgi:hypothetical protein
VRRWETTPTRAKAATPAALKRDPGKEKPGPRERHGPIECGRKRADRRAGPVAPGKDIGGIKTTLAHAAAVHGPEMSVESVDPAPVAIAATPPPRIRPGPESAVEPGAVAPTALRAIRAAVPVRDAHRRLR